MADSKTASEQLVCFHLTTEPNAYLSNWYPSRFEIDGIGYNCAEQYLMHMKATTFGDDEHARAIMETENPSEMQKLGWAVVGFDSDVWAGIRQLVAYRGLKAKFSQNALLRERLVSTGEAVIAECARKDRIWGIGLGIDDPNRFAVSKWPGGNLLGFTLMMVRDEMRADYKDAEAKTPLLHAFAERLAYAARAAGEQGIIAAITPEEMWSFGLVMDCGHSFENMYKQALGNLRMLESSVSDIDDPFILGSAIFSEWRYYTHWAEDYIDDEHVKWFEVAARRLAELTEERVVFN